ncbi:MAG: lysylphosphatidylglycerol synthase domain-containing protein [Cyclobacteriaceae bacterium]
MEGVNKSLKKKYLLILKLTISIGLILFLMLKIDINSFLSSLWQVNIYMFCIAVVISASTIIIKAYKWQILLKIQGARLSLHTLHALSYKAFFLIIFFLDLSVERPIRFIEQ